MEHLKEIESKDLIIGDIYYDIPFINSRATLLKFIGRDKRDLLFEFHSGMKIYIESNDGLIRFKESDTFFK